MKRLENRYVNITPGDLLAAAAPMTGQSLSGSSDVVSAFEADLAERLGCAEAVVVNSGTVSIYCAMHALGIGPGDEVVMAPSAVLMSALPAVLLGAKVVFADTHSLGMGLDVGDVESVLNERTKAVVQVPLWGYPVPMDDLTSLCESKGVALIEDIAQAHGTTWRGRNLGSFGTLGCMSTHERKLIATGEGGAVLTDDPALAGKVRTLRRYGIAPEGIGKVVGLNFKLPAVSAALGRTQVAKLSEKIASRNRVASEIRQVVSGVAWLQEIPVDEASIANYYGFVAACDESINVKDFEQHLASKGVISDTWRYGYKPLYEYPLLQDSVRACPNAEEFIRRVVTLPSHEGMTPADVSQVAEALNSYAA